MDPYRGFHRRFLNKRQGLGGVFENILGSATSSSVSQGTTPSTTSQSNGDPLGIGVFTSVVGGVTSVILPSSSTTATSSTTLTHSSSSSTGSTTPSTSSTKPASSTNVSTPSTTPTPTPTPTPTFAPTSTPSVSDIVYTSSDGTSVVYVTSTLPVASATAAPSTSFLQNPSLEGGVFALVGIVVLAIIFVIVTWTIRKRRRDRLERDIAVAVNFDPTTTDRYEQQEDSIEKHRLSASSSGQGHTYGYGYGYGYGVQPAYAPQQEYHGPEGYGPYPAPGYPGPSLNPAPYQAPSPAISQPAAQGGANLTRKYSDRKPVPPLLPDPAYDPSNAHVSIPPEFYPQQ